MMKKNRNVKNDNRKIMSKGSDFFKVAALVRYTLLYIGIGFIPSAVTGAPVPDRRRYVSVRQQQSASPPP